MRSALLIALLVLGGAATANAGDCRYWLRLDPDAKRADIGAMITAHMTSNNSKRYTSVNRVEIGRCLRGFVGRIVEDVDYACGERPDANAEYVDDIFDRYLLSCV
jgi:hypothetical protein